MFLKPFLFFILFHPLAKANECKRLFKDPKEFVLKMSQNGELSRGQELLFEYYKRVGFSDPEALTGGKSFSNVLTVQEKYPGLFKQPFREQWLSFPIKEFEKPLSLKNFLKSFSSSAYKARNNLYQISANEGFYRKLLYGKKSSQSKQEFLEDLSRFIDKETRAFIEDKSKSYRKRAIALFKVLERIREENLSLGKDIQKVSQALADVIHTVGFGNKIYTELLKSEDSAKNIEGIRKILSERDIVAMELGFEGHFMELKLKERRDFSHKLREIERDIGLQPYVVKSHEHARLRALSLQESPFRSCLGRECSSLTYFERALDPNFIYWTLTDNNHISLGQVTVVLGEAKGSLGQEKTAFVDKIQNIPNGRLKAVLEGIKRSLKEQGFKLGLPVSVGNSNGLSNEDMTRHYVRSEILPYLRYDLKGFKPNDREDDNLRESVFGNMGYTRAYQDLDLLEFEAVDLESIEIKAGEIYPPEKINSFLTVSDLYKDTLILEKSKKEEDRIKFISHLVEMSRVKELGYSKEHVRAYLMSSLKDKNFSFKLRKQALFELLKFNMAKLEKMPLSNLEALLEFFLEKERQGITGELSNWESSSILYKREFIRKMSYDSLFVADVNKLKRNLESKYIFLLNFNTEDFLGLTVLMRAAENGQIETMEWLIEAGADVNAPNNYGLTALMFVAEKGPIKAMEWLIKEGANVHARDEYGQNALIYAGMRKTDLKEKIKLMKWLIKAGADVRVGNRHGLTPLMQATQDGQIELVEWLIEEGADVVHAGDKYGLTPLMQAAKDGKIELMRLFIKEGANVHAGDKYGQTALMYAAEMGQIKAMEWLIEAGADINAQNLYNGQTALIYASIAGLIEAMEWLIKKGANVNIRDKKGQTALIHKAQLRWIQRESIELLVKAGADVDIRDEKGRTALIYTSMAGEIGSMELLIIAGANVNIKDKKGQTALTYAPKWKQRDVEELLIKAGAKKSK